ncbi:MAG: hypothetical protein U5K76_01540 [Woeseiaceae bacterium]|nr:hypothetical protein [Woeseiaceae bacterium]
MPAARVAIATASARPLPRARAAARKPLKTSPAPVVSTACTSCAGTRVRWPASAIRLPRSPSVMTSWRTPSASNASAIRSGASSPRSPYPGHGGRLRPVRRQDIDVGKAGQRPRPVPVPD